MARARQGAPKGEGAPKNKSGRPTDYTEDMAAAICAAVAEHSSLTAALAADESLPSERTVYRWLATRPDFRQAYAHAREVGDEADVAEMRRIAFDPALPADQKRVMVDTIKWEIARRSPKKWGDRVEHTGELTVRRPVEMSDDALAVIAASGRASG